MNAPTLIPSHRRTSNSRGPGQEGTVQVRAAALTRCPKCVAKGLHGTRYGGGPHSPHWVTRDGRQVLVDCAGEPIRCPAVSPQGIQCRLTTGHEGRHLARVEVAHG